MGAHLKGFKKGSVLRHSRRLKGGVCQESVPLTEQRSQGRGLRIILQLAKEVLHQDRDGQTLFGGCDELIVLV